MVYVAVGMFAGWLKVLTIWVVRLDRNRDRRISDLTALLEKLILKEQPTAAAADTRQKQDAA